jgi:hypothetical protein
LLMIGPQPIISAPSAPPGERRSSAWRGALPDLHGFQASLLKAIREKALRWPNFMVDIGFSCWVAWRRLALAAMSEEARPFSVLLVTFVVLLVPRGGRGQQPTAACRACCARCAHNSPRSLAGQLRPRAREAVVWFRNAPPGGGVLVWRPEGPAMC